MMRKKKSSTNVHDFSTLSNCYAIKYEGQSRDSAPCFGADSASSDSDETSAKRTPSFSTPLPSIIFKSDPSCPSQPTTAGDFTFKHEPRTSAFTKISTIPTIPAAPVRTIQPNGIPIAAMTADAHEWAYYDNISSSAAAGQAAHCGPVGDEWSSASLDLPPASDPGGAWATFDALLPHILRSCA
jgi:hypothetical protein